MLHQTKYAVFTIAFVWILYYQLVINFEYFGHELFVKKGVLVHVLLAVFLYRIQSNVKAYGYFKHLLKAAQIVFLSLLLALFINIISGLGLEKIISQMPKAFSDLIMNLTIVPLLIVIAALVCHVFIKKKTVELKVSDHLIDNEN